MKDQRPKSLLPFMRTYRSKRIGRSASWDTQYALGDVHDSLIQFYPRERLEDTERLDQAIERLRGRSFVISMRILGVPHQLAITTEPALRQAAAYEWIAWQMVRPPAAPCDYDIVDFAVDKLFDLALCLRVGWRRANIESYNFQLLYRFQMMRQV